MDHPTTKLWSPLDGEYVELDCGVIDPVRAIWDLGFQTWTSCQGEDGRWFVGLWEVSKLQVITKLDALDVIGTVEYDGGWWWIKGRLSIEAQGD